MINNILKICKTILIILIIWGLLSILLEFFLDPISFWASGNYVYKLSTLGIYIILFITFKNKLKKHDFINSLNFKNSPLEFKKIYSKLFQENISSLEKTRKSLLFKSIIQYLLLFLAIVTFFINKILSLLLICFFLIVFISRKTHYKEYTNLYKTKMLSNFVTLIDKNLVYKNSTSPIVYLDYRNADFERFDKLICDDLITGEFENNVCFKISDIVTKQKRTNKHGHDYYIDSFKGLFSTISSSKDINTSIKIIKNKKNFINSSHKVDLDNSEFEKYFDVYSDDKILSMRLLTSDIMEYLIDFCNKYNTDYEIIIKNNMIYFRFFTGSMFEAPLLKNSMNENLLLYYYLIIKFVFELSKLINSTLNDIDL